MPRASKRLRFQHKTGKDTDASMEGAKVDANENNLEDEDDLNNFRMYTTYITVTVKLPKDSDFIKYLHDKYTILIDTLLQVDEEL